MRHIIFAIGILCLCTLSCKKKDCTLQESTKVAPETETAVIETYLSGQGITATKHSSGLYYQIISQGKGLTPSLCSNITVRYKGTLLNGNKFDESTSNVSFILGNLIVGWQKGLSLIQKSGSIKLFVPPSLGYGSTSSGSIPANSTLIFEIELIGVVD